MKFDNYEEIIAENNVHFVDIDITEDRSIFCWFPKTERVRIYKDYTEISDWRRLDNNELVTGISYRK